MEVGRSSRDNHEQKTNVSHSGALTTLALHAVVYVISRVSWQPVHFRLRYTTLPITPDAPSRVLKVPELIGKTLANTCKNTH